MKLKSNKAITLVALIITIIVLLILAGVTLNMVLGDNGLINKAQSSVDKYKESAENEQALLNEIEEYISTKGKKDGAITLSAKSGTYTYPTKGSFEVTSDISGGEVTAISSDEDIVKVSVKGSIVTVTPQIKGGTATITVNCKGETVTHEATVDFILPVVAVKGEQFFVLEDKGSSLTLLSKEIVSSEYWENAKTFAANYGRGLGGSGRLMTKAEADTLGAGICACGEQYWLNDGAGSEQCEMWDGTITFYYHWTVLSSGTVFDSMRESSRGNRYSYRGSSYRRYSEVCSLIHLVTGSTLLSLMLDKTRFLCKF